MIFKDCNGYCILANHQCNGKRDKNECWESSLKKCLDPKFDGTRKPTVKGVYVWKSCNGKCIITIITINKS